MAAAAPAAIDEYSLGALEATDVDPTNTQQATEERGEERPDPKVPPPTTSGVVGEGTPTSSSLAAAGSGVWVLVGVLALGGVAAFILAPARRSRPRT